MDSHQGRGRLDDSNASGAPVPEEPLPPPGVSRVGPASLASGESLVPLDAVPLYSPSPLPLQTPGPNLDAPPAGGVTLPHQEQDTTSDPSHGTRFIPASAERRGTRHPEAA